MIRIYNKNRNDQISNNVAYTSNPHLYNLNDWVVITRDEAPELEGISPYVFVTRYSKEMLIDNKYEIIICTSDDELRALLEHNLENKVVYVLHQMNDEQIENAMPALVVNTFNKETQIKVNHRNLFVTGDNFGYSLQVNKIFYYETYSFLKLKMSGNNLVYISSELECNELYTNIGVVNPIDISGLEKIDNNLIEFTVADRFNKYNVVSNLVLDLDYKEIRNAVQIDFRLNYLNFAHKAYLTITGLRDAEEIKFIEGTNHKLLANKTNQLMMNLNDAATKAFDSNASVLVRNYITEIPTFKTNIKRQKRAETTDISTKLIIIYDPNDRGFINAIDRTNSFEIAFNKAFSFDQLKAFAEDFAKSHGIELENIVYLLDDSIEDQDYNSFTTSSLSIKNSISYKQNVYNFTNVKISQITTTETKLFMASMEYDKENDTYELLIPEQLVNKNVFIKIGGKTNHYEAINVKTDRIGLFASFFTEVLNLSGDIQIQLAIIDGDTIYESNTYNLTIDNKQIAIDYKLSAMCIYTIVDEHQLTTIHLEKIKAKYQNADVHIVKYQNSPEFEQFVKDHYDLEQLTVDQYACLYPLYLDRKGYKYVSYLADGTIYTEDSLLVETDSKLLDIRTVIADNYQIYIPKKINYFTLSIKDYISLLSWLRTTKIYGIINQVSSVEHPEPTSPVIDFVHKFNPWDSNNSQVFKQYTEQGIFINSELTTKLVGNTDMEVYSVPVKELILRNNQLLNIGNHQMKLSIIITTYCNEDAIFDTLKYIVDNIGLVPRDFEILIFDDCSKDNTIGKVTEFFELYPHINNTVKVNERNMRYPGYGANSGIRIARGKYVHIVDGDDKVLNGIYNVLNRPQLSEDVVSFGHYNYDVTRQEYIQGRYYSFNEFTDSYPYEKSKQEYKMLQANVTHWNKFFKTSFLRDNNLYYLENQLVQDSAFLTDVYYCKPTVRHIPEIGYIYHIGHESVSSGRKGYKLFVDFVNANMKRTPLVNSFFPQYTYTMKRFMIYDEIKDEELESIVDLLREKYANNYRIGDIDFFNKGQLLHKMMHNLIMRQDYDKIRTFLKITEEFKQSSEYNDSKYYDLFLGINKLNVVGHFIVNVKLFATLYEAEIAASDEDILEQFKLYYNAVKANLENEIKTINQVYSENGKFYQNKYDYVLANFEKTLSYVYSLDLDIAQIEYSLETTESIKSAAKVIVIKNSNDYLVNQLRMIDNQMAIYEIDGDDETIINHLSNIYNQNYGQNKFALILDGTSDFDFNNLYLIYHTAYSVRDGLICLTGQEEDDMFNVINRYLINIDLFTNNEFSHQSLFKINHTHKRTVMIALNEGQQLFEHVSLMASGYGNVSTEKMELLNRLYHTSETIRKVSYDERKQANMYLFDFNVVEGK